MFPLRKRGVSVRRPYTCRVQHTGLAHEWVGALQQTANEPDAGAASDGGVVTFAYV